MNIEGYRLSPQQGRLWRLERLGVEGSFRVLGMVLVHGAVEPRALEEAIGRVAARHEILRTVFQSLAGMSAPLQTIGAPVLAPIETVDLSETACETEDMRLAELFDELRHARFDLSKGPLLQVRTVLLAPPRQAFLVSAPALCADATTLHILFNEIADELDSRSPQTSPPQYADLAEWANELLTSDAAVAWAEFWPRQITPASLAGQLPGERPGREGWAFEPCWTTCTIPSASAALIRSVAAAHEVAISNFFLACWRALLYRLTGQSDQAIAVGCHGRTYEELVSAAGPLSRYLPIRVDCTDETPFADVMRVAGQLQVEAFEQQEHFTWDTTDSSTGRDRPAFLPFGFDFEAVPTPRRTETGATLSLERLYHCVDRFKARISVEDRGDALLVALYYDANVLQAAEAARLIERFQCVVHGAASAPWHTVGELDVLTEPERHRLLVEFNDTRAEYPADRRITDLLEEGAARAPEAAAVVAGEARLTYPQLHDRANRLARYLQRQGVTRGTMVGLHVDQSVDVLVGLLGILKAGGAYVPLDPEYPRERIELILQDTRAPVVVTKSHLSAAIAGHEARPICVDMEWEVIAAESGLPVSADATPNDLAYVIYTSGSTGRPKGVPITHGNLVHSTSARTTYYREPVERYLLLSSFAFDSSVAGIFWTLCQGGTIVLAPEGVQRDPGRIADLVEREAVTHLLCLPTLYSLLLATSGLGQLASLRTVIVAGEACPVDLVRTHANALPRATLFNEYGPTEGTVWSTVFDCSRYEGDGPVPIGRPIPNVRVYVLDRNQRPVPIGVPGELYIGGAGVAGGYLNRPDLTSERFLANPCSPSPSQAAVETMDRLYRTGDLVSWLPDGNLEFLGRVDQQVKIRGYRVELGEIEAVLARHPSVKQSVVAAHGDPSGERLVAYLVPVDGQAPAVETVRDFLATSLPVFMVPSAFVFLDELPLNANGKVDRQALPEPGGERPGLAKGYTAPRNALEEVLAGLWAAVLDLEKVGIHDNFFDLGGHSILVTRLAGQIRETLRVDVPLRAVFETPTIAGLAETLLRDPAERARIEKVVDLLVQVAGLADDEVEQILKGTASEGRVL